MDQNNYEIVWGIDVSKSWLDISIDGKVTRIDYSPISLLHSYSLTRRVTTR
jgi:hypothetical protein